MTGLPIIDDDDGQAYPLAEDIDELSAAVQRFTGDPDGYEGKEIHYNSVLIGVELDVGGFKRMQYPASRSELMDLVATIPLHERVNLDRFAPDLLAALEYVLVDDGIEGRDRALAVYAEIVDDEELIDFTLGSVAQSYDELRRMYPVLTDLAESRGFFAEYLDNFEGDRQGSIDPDAQYQDGDFLDLSDPKAITNIQIIDYITATGIDNLLDFADNHADVYGLAQTRHVLRRESLEKVPLATAVFEEMADQDKDFVVK